MESIQNNIERLIKFVDNKLDNEAKRIVELSLLDDPVQLQIVRGLFLLRKNHPKEDLAEVLEEKQSSIKKKVFEKIALT